MRTWPKYPVIYEINTWVWLAELGRKYHRPVNLATIPDQEWDSIASHGFDAVWFMSVWERDYIQDLKAAARYLVEGDNLHIDLKADTGTMRFVKRDGRGFSVIRSRSVRSVLCDLYKAGMEDL